MENVGNLMQLRTLKTKLEELIRSLKLKPVTTVYYHENIPIFYCILLYKNSSHTSFKLKLPYTQLHIKQIERKAEPSKISLTQRG